MFLDAIVPLLHIYYRFLLEKQIFESSKWGRLQDPVMERPGHQIMGRSEDARGTSVIQSVLLRFVIHMQKNNLIKHKLYKKRSKQAVYSISECEETDQICSPLRISLSINAE